MRYSPTRLKGITCPAAVGRLNSINHRNARSSNGGSSRSTEGTAGGVGRSSSCSSETGFPKPSQAAGAIGPNRLTSVRAGAGAAGADSMGYAGDSGGDGGAGPSYRPVGLYGMTDDELLELLWQAAGLQALQFAPALPHMAASLRYSQVCTHNLAAWVSLLADLEVRSPAAVLASCPAFLMVPLTVGAGAEGEQQGGHGEPAAPGRGVGAETLDASHPFPPQAVSRDVPVAAPDSGRFASSSAVVPECEYGGAEYGAAVRRFVVHCRDELLMDERQVFGLLARLPSLAHVPPSALDQVIVYLSVVIKGAGRGHRLGPKTAEDVSPPPSSSSSSVPLHGASGGLSSSSPPPPVAQPPPPPPPQLPEEAELDQALYRFLRRAPAVLAMTRYELSYTLERLSYYGGGGLETDYCAMCRLLCAVPELLPAVAARLAEAPQLTAAGGTQTGTVLRVLGPEEEAGGIRGVAGGGRDVGAAIRREVGAARRAVGWATAEAGVSA